MSFIPCKVFVYDCAVHGFRIKVGRLWKAINGAAGGGDCLKNGLEVVGQSHGGATDHKASIVQIESVDVLGNDTQKKSRDSIDDTNETNKKTSLCGIQSKAQRIVRNKRIRDGISKAG